MNARIIEKNIHSNAFCIDIVKWIQQDIKDPIHMVYRHIVYLLNDYLMLVFYLRLTFITWGAKQKLYPTAVLRVEMHTQTGAHTCIYMEQISAIMAQGYIRVMSQMYEILLR